MKTNNRIKLVVSILVLVVMVACALFPAHVGELAGTSLMAAPLVTAFTKEVEEHLYPDNAFYMNAVDDSPYLKGKTVTRGVSGDDPEVVTNPTEFPLTAVQRVDDENKYDISLHATIPTHLQDEEELLVNYNKRQSIQIQHASVLNVKTAVEFVKVWSPSLATNFVRTTGADIQASTSGATGTRKALTKDDFINAVNILDNMDAGDDGLVGLISANMYAQLLKIPDFVDYNKTGRADVLAKGMIGEICGIKLYKRSKAGIYTNASTPVKKDISLAGAATDNEALLIWDPKKVYRALSSPTVYINPGKAEYLGTIMNMSVRAGGTIRKDQKGVVAIIQAAGA